MALRAKTTDYWDLPAGQDGEKRQVSVRIVIYDDADPNQTPLGQPIDMSKDLEGFLAEAKSSQAREDAVRAHLRERLQGEPQKARELREKSAIAARSWVGLDFALDDLIEIAKG